MPELIYLKSYILSAMCIAKRLKNMENVIRGLEATYAVICERQQEELRASSEELFGGNVLMLSSYRLTKGWANKNSG